jgi:ABC-type dipeptide/oligopeptide/nickel transport system permease subunit
MMTASVLPPKNPAIAPRLLPKPEWGAMLASARNHIRDYPHMVIFPGIFIMITVLSFNLIGDAIRDALDPKLKD